MTSSNVSNLLVQVSRVEVASVSEKANVSTDKTLFENTLKNVAGSGTPVEVAKGENNKSKLEDKPFEPTAKAKADSIKPEDAKTLDREDLQEKVMAAGEEVKEVIEDELDVTTDELEQAMQNLGFTILDLFNPQNLAQLVVELTGETDSVNLLMDESFKNVLDEVTQITNQLFDDLNISFENLKEIQPLDIKPEEIVIPKEEPKIEIPVEVLEQEAETTQEVVDYVPVEKQQILTEANIQNQEMPKQPEEVKVMEDVTPVEESAVENKPQLENDNDNSKKEFDFSQEKTGAQAPKLNHEKANLNEGVNFFGPQPQLTFTPAQQVVTLPTGESVRAESIVQQLVEQAKVMTDIESTTMELTLNPEGLGKIFMEVTQKGDEITAKIFTENDAVKQALENQMANLRLELNQNSAKVTSIEVSVGTHEFERNLEQNAQDESRRDDQMRKEAPRRNSRIDLNNLDELTGIMSDEDMLIAQMMMENGNTLDFQA